MKRALAALLTASFITAASAKPDPPTLVKEPSRQPVHRIELRGDPNAPDAAGPTIELQRVAEPPKAPGATEPDLAIDPADPARMVVGAVMGAMKLDGQSAYPVFASSDGGLTWTRATGPAPSHAGDPGVEFALDGTVYLSSLDPTTRDGTPVGITVARSTDGGKTFHQPTYAMDTSTAFAFPDGQARKLCGEEGNFFDFPKLAVDRGDASPYRNHLYLIANGISFDADGDGICESAAHLFVRSIDGGLHWDSAQSMPAMKQYTGSLAVGTDGTIYIADPTLGTPLCPGGAGLSTRRSIDGGRSFLAGCAPTPGVKVSGDPTWTAADPGDPGKVAIAFAGAIPGSAGVHVFVVRSSDAGQTWSEPVRVDDLLSRDAVDRFRPALSISESGRLDLIWADYRNSKGGRYRENRQPGDVYYAYSRDGGISWSRNIRLTASAAPLLYGAGNDSLGIVSSEDKAFAVFAQDRDGNVLYETYLATITFP